MWKEVLEKGGYKTISVGSYSHKEEGTTIYTKNADLGADLRSISRIPMCMNLEWMK